MICMPSDFLVYAILFFKKDSYSIIVPTFLVPLRLCVIFYCISILQRIGLSDYKFRISRQNTDYV